jgi:CRP-like cAMP-binding protein
VPHPASGQTCACLQGFADAKRVTNMWCKTPCYMLRISRADMHDLLQQYPQLLETIKTLNLERRNNNKAA